jgi:hypothetical protein
MERFSCMKQGSLLAVLLFALSVSSLFAQNPAITPAPTPAPVDSTRQLRSASDTIPQSVERNGIKVGNSILQPDNDSTSLATDTVRLTAKQEAEIRRIVPRKATIRSLMLPGLGQAYNRQYYKIPFIYAGFGVMGYLFVKYRDLANQAENGYRELLYGREVSKGVFEPVTQVVIGEQIVKTTTGAKAGYDLYRRYRDMNILLSVALWGINIVEANVAAHLKTFDLSDDISMRVQPNVLPIPGAGLVPGVRVAFTFK